MLIGSIIVLFLLAAILIVGLLLLPSLAMAQQEQQQTTTTTVGGGAAAMPLTLQEQEQQNRLQNVIAATTADLNETEKQVSGIVYTPRWSDVVWVSANSVAVLIAYCLPGEFADSGQEVLAGFRLEVLESYAVDLPQGFMTWMAIVGNQDENARLPAAVGVICASDINRTDTRILTPQEQQQINNVISQFTTIQNTQITNIDQVINIINNVTSTPPAHNETGGGTPTTQQPLTVEATANVTEAYGPVWIKFDVKVTGGIPPYNYSWSGFGSEILEKSFTQFFDQPSCEPSTTYCNDPFIFEIEVTDSRGQTASGYVPINITIEPLTVEIIPNATSGFTQDRFELKSNVRGGTLPYTYSWNFAGDFQNFAAACNVLKDPTAVPDNSCIVFDTDQPGTFDVTLNVDDSKGRGSFKNILINVEPRPPGGEMLLLPETGEEGQPSGGGLLPGTPPPPSNDTGRIVLPPSEEEGGGGGESPPSTTEEQEPLPLSDDTTGGGG